MNNVNLIGRLTKDPVLRKTTSGKSVVNFTLAVDRRKGANADPSEPTADFISCVAWSQVADLIAQYTNKGSRIGVEGRLQVRNYQDNNNSTVYITEVVVSNLTFCENKKNPTETAVDTPTFTVTADDLPF